MDDDIRRTLDIAEREGHSPVAAIRASLKRLASRSDTTCSGGRCTTFTSALGSGRTGASRRRRKMVGSLDRTGAHLMALLALVGISRGTSKIGDVSPSREKHPKHPALRRSRHEKRRR